MVTFDQNDNSVVISGFEAGIADSPFDGIADIKNVNIISVPGEASVNFATAQISNPTIGTGTISSADPATEIVTFSGASGLEFRMAVIFSGGSLPAGITAGTIYWVDVLSSTTLKVYSDFAMSSLVNITATGTGTFTVIPMSQPKYFTIDTSGPFYYMVDSLGQVWTNRTTTTSGYWRFAGNQVPDSGYTSGNGIVYYQASDGTGYVFVFHKISIDYMSTIDMVWHYQWNPSAGTVGAYSSTPSQVMKATLVTATNHEAMVAPDNRVYFCDTYWIGRFYQKDPAVAFVPTTAATYVFDQTALLPITDNANCLAYLGTNMLVGGKNNVIYPWDRFSTNYNYPILLAESNVQKMITVNTVTYIFVGNRGRIYSTSGSLVSLFKKIPDHISGTVEPYFTWGGVASNKNQIYFSALVKTNAGTALTVYGGLWAIDIDTQAIRLVNKLSYGTYAGYATAIVPNTTSNPAGTGLYIGWDNNSSVYGIDTTVSTPYTGSQAVIESDLIPIATNLAPRNFTTVEYRLTKPLVSGESITVNYRLDFSQSWNQILTDNTVGHFSGKSLSIPFKNAQWLQLQVVLNSTANNPSFTRLKEIRIR